jgi:hypothetical protein
VNADSLHVQLLFWIVGDDGAVFTDSETLRPGKSDYRLARRHSPDHPEIQ